MLYICIPSHNEAETIGLLLWRIRKVFQGYSREYEIIVYDDASTDSTKDVLEPYAEVAPLTVLRGDTRKGYGGSLETLVREASKRTRYPRRDAMVVMQADFTDLPENLPELAKRFDGGADIVLGERGGESEPAATSKLRRFGGWALRLSSAAPGVKDPGASFRAYRISILRDLLKAGGEDRLITADGWAANVELLLLAKPFARRIESVAVESKYDLRTRPSRIRPVTQALGIYRLGRAMRRRKPLVLPPEPPQARAEQEKPARHSGRRGRKRRAGS